MAKKKPSNKKKILKKDKPTILDPIVLSQKNFWQENLIPILILFLLSILLYLPSLGFDHVLDDTIVITDNDYTKKGFAGIKDIFSTDSFQGYFGEQKKMLEGGRYRPLSIVTFAIEYQFFGLSAKAGHFNNILLYALSGLLLFRVLLLLIPSIKSKEQWYYSLPFVASLLFILHPIHTEVVANIKGRDEILALFFSLSALYFSIKYVRSQSLILLAGVCLSLFLGLLAKENALTWLVIIPMSLYFFTKSKFSTIGKITLALFVTVLVYFAVRYNALGYFISSGEESTSIMNNPFYGLDAGKKAATIMYTLGVYIKLLLFPHPLTHDYYPFQIPILTFGDWKAILALVVNLGLGVYALFGIRKKSIISYGILFYFITLSIVSNIFVNVGTTMNERFVYMSSVGFCIILAYFISRWLPAKLDEDVKKVNIIGLGLLCLLLIGYGAKTTVRVPDWKNPLSLNSAAVKYSPNSARANCFMGVALFEDYKVEQDQARRNQLLDESTFYINRALDLYPGYGNALTMKSGILAEHYKKDFDIDKLLAGFTNILQYNERTPFTDEYIQYLIDQNRNPEKVAQFLYNIGFALNYEKRRSYIAAIHYLKYAYQIDPRNHNVIRALGNSYRNIGNEAEANKYLRQLD